jgi:hypothetical protein
MQKPGKNIENCSEKEKKKIAELVNVRFVISSI